MLDEFAALVVQGQIKGVTWTSGIVPANEELGRPDIKVPLTLTFHAEQARYTISEVIDTDGCSWITMKRSRSRQHHRPQQRSNLRDVR